MQTGGPSKSLLGQKIMVIAAAIVALIVSLVVVPPIALRAGLFEKHVGYATAAVAFLIVIVAVRWFKSLDQTPAGKPGKPPRKR